MYEVDVGGVWRTLVLCALVVVLAHRPVLWT
jgi:hypothetical protein